MKTIFDYKTATGVNKINDTTVYVKDEGFLRTNTFKNEGKWYFEFFIKKKSGCTLGLSSEDVLTSYPGISLNSYGITIHSNYLYTNADYSSVNWRVNEGDYLGFCVDLTTKQLLLYVNGEKTDTISIKNIGKKCFIAIGSGGNAGSEIELITNFTSMKYGNYYPIDFKPWDNDTFYLISDGENCYSVDKILPKLIKIGEPISNQIIKEKGFNLLKSLLKETDSEFVLMKKVDGEFISEEIIDFESVKSIDRVSSNQNLFLEIKGKTENKKLINNFDKFKIIANKEDNYEK